MFDIFLKIEDANAVPTAAVEFATETGGIKLFKKIKKLVNLEMQ